MSWNSAAGIWNQPLQNLESSGGRGVSNIVQNGVGGEAERRFQYEISSKHLFIG